MTTKLELKKKTISILSDDQLKTMEGGLVDPVTTSFGQCTGFTCCDDTLSIKIAVSILVTISIIVP